LADGKGRWEGELITACFEGWYKDRSVAEQKAMPCIMVWAIWLARYEITFQDKEILPIQICH
jgi:hypothetical protein